MHVHTHTHTRTHTDAHTYKPHAHVRMHTHAQMYACTYTREHLHARPPLFTHSYTITLLHTMDTRQNMKRCKKASDKVSVNNKDEISNNLLNTLGNYKNLS